LLPASNLAAREAQEFNGENTIDGPAASPARRRSSGSIWQKKIIERRMFVAANYAVKRTEKKAGWLSIGAQHIRFVINKRKEAIRVKE
jgi:hypothetical protein